MSLHTALTVSLPLLQHAAVTQNEQLPGGPSTTALIFPESPLASSSSLLVAEDAYITPEFDAAFLVVIPILFGGAIFGFWKLLKLFASAF